MIVKSHMIDEPVFAYAEDSLRQAHERMVAHDIHHLPVVDDDRRVVGIISEHDVLVPRYLAPGKDRAGRLQVEASVVVADAMTRDPITLRPSDGLKMAIDQLLTHSFNAVPVVDDAGRLVGMLTTKDLLKVLRDQLG